MDIVTVYISNFAEWSKVEGNSNLESELINNAVNSLDLLVETYSKSNISKLKEFEKIRLSTKYFRRLNNIPFNDYKAIYLTGNGLTELIGEQEVEIPREGYATIVKEYCISPQKTKNFSKNIN